MHILFGMRGIKHRGDEFIKQLSCQYLPFKHKGQNSSLQVRVSPIQLYDVSFPKEHKDILLTTLFPGQEKGRPIHKRYEKVVWALRKIFGLEPIPETWDTSRKLPCHPEDTEMIALGLKEDRFVSDGETEQI